MGRRLTSAGLIAAVLGTGLLVGGCPLANLITPTTTDVAKGLVAETLLTGLSQPTGLAFAEDGRIFVAEKNTGQIRVIKDGALLDTPFATLPVNTAGDRGLLSIALHPSFSVNQRVYVLYSRSDTETATSNADAIIDNRVVYFEASGDVAGSGEVFVVSLPFADSSERVGGKIAFAPGARLIVAMGDLTNADGAQDDDLLHGKVLRYNDDGTIPSDNPVENRALFARGFREPIGLSIDPFTGAIFVTERSLHGNYEVNRVQAGKNYGWPEVSGVADLTAETDWVAQQDDYVDPLAVSTIARPSLIGGAFNPYAKYGTSTKAELFFGVNEDAEVVTLGLLNQQTEAGLYRTFATGVITPIEVMAFTPSGTLYVATPTAIARVVPID
jgi:glucose/arabinose dehydrogenase